MAAEYGNEVVFNSVLRETLKELSYQNTERAYKDITLAKAQNVDLVTLQVPILKSRAAVRSFLESAPPFLLYRN